MEEMSDLEKVIKKIINIEQQAQRIVDSAEVEKQEKEAELKVKLEALEKKLIDAAHEKVAQIREMEIKEAKQVAESKSAGCTSRLAKMEKHYNKSKDLWCSQLVDAVLKR